MMNVIRIAKIVALLAFVLPWVAVSCQGVDLATASGVELIQGKMTTNQDASQQVGGRLGVGPGLSTPDARATPQEAPDLGMNYFALGAGIVIVAGLALTFLTAGKAAARNAVITSALAAALAFGAVWQFKETIKAEIMRDGGAGGMDAMGENMLNGMLQERIGFWIVLGALVVAAGVGGVGLASTAQAARPEGS